MGGAGGHMWHPYDCPEVLSGADLIDVFKKSGGWLRANPGSLKVDGVNLSCRLKKNPDWSTGYEFVVDRGATSGPSGVYDMKGVTAKNAHLRFVNKSDPSVPHGMVANTANLLKILNAALPDIMPELKKLGFLESKTEIKTNQETGEQSEVEVPVGFGPTGRYFNMEYVDVSTGAANVKKYPFNFIAFHGVRKFHMKPGNKARGFKDIPVDQSIINQMVKKIQPFAAKAKFRAFSKIETKLAEPINIDSILNTNFTIVLGKMSDEPGALIEQSTKPLKQWLSEIESIPKQDVVTLNTNTSQQIGIPITQNAFAKKLYAAVYHGAAISDMLDKTKGKETFIKNAKAISDAAVVWEATRVVGNHIIKASQSDLGPLYRGKNDQEEGVVVAPGDFCSGTAFKYSGDFILDNLKSGFGLSESLLKEQQEESNIKKVIAIYPGRFQPAGRHHAAAYNWLKTTFGADETYVATSDKVEFPKSPFTFEEKQSILGAHGIPAEKIVKTSNPYKAEEITSQFDPETTAVVFMVGEKDMQESPRFANVGGKLKSGKDAYLKKFDDHRGTLEPLSKHGYLVVAKHIALPVPGHGEMSGTALRAFLGGADQEQFKSIMGFWDQEIYDMIRNKLNNKDQEGQESNFLSVESLFSLVDDVLLEKKMTKGDKIRDTKLKKKMDKNPDIKKDFIKRYGREEGEKIYFATIRKRAMAENQINEIDERGARNAIGGFLQKLFLGTSLKNLDTEKMSNIADSIADDIIGKIKGAAGEQKRTSMKQKSDAIQKSVAEASAAGGGGVAGFAGRIGDKEKENVKRRA